MTRKIISMVVLAAIAMIAFGCKGESDEVSAPDPSTVGNEKTSPIKPDGQAAAGGG